MKKNNFLLSSLVFIIIFFINENIFAQAPLNEKGVWGVNAGANIFYPTFHHYITNSGPSPYFTDYVVTPFAHLGYFFGVSRTFSTCKIQDKNPIDIEIGLSYNQRSAMLKYGAVNVMTNKDTSGEVLQKENYLSLDIKFSNTLNFKEKYGISNSIGLRTNSGFYKEEYYLTYSLGFIFYFKKINIMPMVNTTIFDLRKNPYDNYTLYWPLDKDLYQLINFGVNIYFNNPFKKNKDEKK